MDLLPAQASAVPCERIFSSGKQTCTDRRNRLSPDTIEILQVLKFAYSQDQLNFEDPVMKEEDLYYLQMLEERLGSKCNCAK